MLPPVPLEHTITGIVREDWGRMLAALLGSFNDWQLAEDVLQDAFEQALVVWPRDGLPNSPSAWLLTAARRKAIDHFRRSQRFHELIPEFTRLADQTYEFEDRDSVFPDKRLELIFACCHPALDRKTQTALTLRTLGGLTTEEIASAFLDKPATMAQRLSRAKHKIRAAAIPFVIPRADNLQERTSAVLSVIYLIFNEGYTASTGEGLTRTDLSDEAIRLARIVLALLPEEAEVAGLLSLMLLHDSRRCSRQASNNSMVPLEHQRRALWDKGKIAEGVTLLKSTLVKQQVGAYQLQAAISAVHAEALSWEETDWAQINALYELLHAVQPSSVVRVNQAIALSYAQSVTAALDLLLPLAADKAMLNYQPYYVARADLYYRAGLIDQAITDMEIAIKLSANDARVEFLKSRLASFRI